VGWEAGAAIKGRGFEEEATSMNSHAAGRKKRGLRRRPRALFGMGGMIRDTEPPKRVRREAHGKMKSEV
jgi:hypothetical protein